MFVDVAGFTAMGMDVILVGPMPTPAVAMLTRSLRVTHDNLKLRDPAFVAQVDSGQLGASLQSTGLFPHEPLVRVRGPILQCQIIETPLLNMINFATLIATWVRYSPSVRSAK